MPTAVQSTPLTGQTLEIGGNGNIVNTGTFEATNGGILLITASNPVNNQGGSITASGSGSTVNIMNATIQGGTLTTSGGGVMQTVNSAVLDGSTHGAITIADGSTYLAAPGTANDITGTLNLGTATGGTLALGGNMRLVGDTTLSGPGSLILTAGSQIGTNGNGFTLTNDSTIQGAGLIGANVGSLYGNGNVTNNGVIDAVGGTLNVAGTGTVTNNANGTLEASNGSTLHVSAPLSASNFSGGELSGGSYEAFNGTVQIDSFGSTGGEVTTNAANVVLSGPSAEITDAANKNALANFQDNLASGSFTVEDGQQFVTASAFANAGAVEVGGSSSFTTAGIYVQSGGTTQVDGTLTATGGQVNINAGTLSGTGAVAGNVNIAANGTLSPGDSGPGTISIGGDYTQLGTLDEEIAGTSASGMFDMTAITGMAAIGGATLDISLLNGYMPAANSSNSYVILTATGGRTGMFGTVDFMNLAAGDTFSVDYSNPNEVILDVNGQSTSPTPEPGFLHPARTDARGADWL